MASWDRLFRFGSLCLTLPRRGGRQRSLAATQLLDEADPVLQAIRRGSGSQPVRDPLRYLAKRVSTKLEEGDYRGAVRISCSEDTIAEIDSETLSLLKEKHPPAHPDSVPFCT